MSFYGMDPYGGGMGGFAAAPAMDYGAYGGGFGGYSTPVAAAPYSPYPEVAVPSPTAFGAEYYGGATPVMAAPEYDVRTSPVAHRRMSPVADRRYSAGGKLTESALRSREDRRPQRDADVVSTGSRRSSVGSQWRSVTTDGPYSRMQRMKQQGQTGEPGCVPKPTGRRLALLVAINKERSRASTNSCRHMNNLLRRYGYTVEQAIYDGDPEQFEADIEAGILGLTSMAESGDAVFFHAIGYGVFEGQNLNTHVQQLVSGLPPGTKLSLVLDCCYCSAKPAFSVDPKQSRPRSRKEKRYAVPIGPSQPINPALFAFIGDCSNKDIATFESSDGAACVFTAAFILAYNKKDLKGYWNEPPTYASLAGAIQKELYKITSQMRRSMQVISSISCSDQYDIDQPAWL